MGHLLGPAVGFGPAGDVMAAGEGIETMLSLRTILPGLPLAAALSAAHLAGMLFSPGERARERRCAGSTSFANNDPAGRHASATLTGRAQAAGVEALTLVPALRDVNDNLRQFGPDALAASVRVQLAPEDVNPDGRCDPSHATLAADSGESVSTVKRALEGFLACGMVSWVRRLVRDGWRACQTSNAYLLTLGKPPQIPGKPCEVQTGRETGLLDKSSRLPSIQRQSDAKSPPPEPL